MATASYAKRRAEWLSEKRIREERRCAVCGRTVARDGVQLYVCAKRH